MIRLFTIPTDSVAFDNVAADTVTFLADEGILHPSEIADIVDAEHIGEGEWRVAVEVV